MTFSPADIHAILAIVGLTLITFITRAFFFISDREWELPAWAQQGLRFAPLAALAAVIVPEIIMTQGHLISTFKDPRIFAAITATAYYFWRRGLLGTIIVGMVVLLVLKMGLRW